MLLIRWTEILLIVAIIVGAMAVASHAKIPLASMKARCVDDKKVFVCYPTSKGIVYDNRLHSSSQIVKAWFDSKLGFTLLIDKDKK